MRQKRIALVNDLTGYGRCSLSVELPLISALKVQACPLPTALLSVHTGFASHYMVDCTDIMEPYIDNWHENELYFDGICTGFLSSKIQVGIVLAFIERFRRTSTMVLFDPVMGDDGKLYSSYTPELCQEMRRLLAKADVITPNLTEACTLLNWPYPEQGLMGEERLLSMAEALSAKGPSRVIITGLEEKGEICNYLYERGQKPQFVRRTKVGENRSGTGDVFTAILAASLIQGESLLHAVTKAADFIVKAMAYTESLDLPWNHGLAFEEYLTDLS